MAAGLPIICSNFDFWDELIFKEYKCAIKVDPLSSLEIADAVERLIYSDIDSKKMIREGTRAIKETFNWKIEEKKLYDVYNNLN
jgi:glycosyltransferase involved in cell wall biosynthesis